MTFQELGLAEPLLRSIREEGYETPTPIQIDAIPHALAGRDVLGVAQTGTGKTAAFALPLLQRLSASERSARPGHPRALVLTPTRELAIQIDASFATYGRHVPTRHTVVYGGVGQNPQVRSLSRGIEILTATPGRLLDLLEQGWVSLDDVEAFVLDEADRMLDMGFLPDVRRVIARLPGKRQTLFFSATMPATIVELSRGILLAPVRCEVTPEATTVDKVDQRVLFVDGQAKRDVVAHVVASPSVRRALVFTRTKHGANRLAERLRKAGLRADAIHGNKSQGARQHALESFRSGETPILVATDLAARGIDVEDVTHVINYELPNEAESYVHRIGRTARAGAAGMALSLCDRAEVPYLRDIESLIGMRLRVMGDRIGLPENVVSPGPVEVRSRSQRPSGPRSGARRFGRR